MKILTEYNKHILSKVELLKRLNEAKNKTLGEIDSRGRFDRIAKMKKVTGIAGTIVEESIIGYKPDNNQRPDILLDGIPTEIKTTGIRRTKNNGRMFTAKEPVSITAVSPEKITSEEFNDSNFWHKLEHLLLVYYLYDSSSTVKAQDYADFPLIDYEFVQFDSEQQKILARDWTLVRDFLRNIQENFSKPEGQYHRLSSELRQQLMFIDTAPKYPRPPRFRLKRSVVDSIVAQHFGEHEEELNTPITSYDSFDKKLHHLGEVYSGLTVRELLRRFEIKWRPTKKTGDVGKGITADIISSMFGAATNKLSKIKLFRELGIVVKSLTITKTGKRTEDFKISGLDLPSWTREKDDFFESLLYSYFSESQFLIMVFEEPSNQAKLLDSKFIGFKRLTFPQSFIEDYVQRLWRDTREKISAHTLKVFKIYGADGKPAINKKTGTIKEATNFMKASENKVFIRGSGQDSTKKTVCINGLMMYTQDVWVKGKTLVEMLDRVDYI